MSLSDSRKMWKLLNEAGAEGMHSHELRRRGVTGNPSQRAKDIVSRGVSISTKREAVGKRPGSRYWLAEHAPSDAVAVLPNHATRTCRECGNSIEHLRGNARFCDSTCRARHSEHADASTQPVSAHKRSVGEIRRAAPDTVEPVAIIRDGDSFAEVPIDPRPCRRCDNTGELASGEPCPACDGEGLISRRRVNSYIEPEQRAA